MVTLSGNIELLDRLDCLLGNDQALPLGLLLADLSSVRILDGVLGYRKIAEILAAIEARIKTILRPSDVLVRTSDYQFAVVITGMKFDAMAELAASRIVREMQGLQELTAHNVAINPFIGIALFPGHANNAEDLLQAVEAATRDAVRCKRTLVQADSGASIRQERRLELDLQSILMRSELELYYQPKVDIRARSLYGAEALLRWEHPDLGMVSPDTMIPIIENSPQAREITLWILNTALNQSRHMRKLSPDFRIAVNLPANMVDDTELVELVGQALRTWDTDPCHLILEVTETSMLGNYEACLANLRRLDSLGVLLAIDDFGTGYSSFSYLQKLPVTELKIDKSFVTDMHLDRNAESLVRAMVNLGREFGLEVLAEGIECPEVLNCLLNMGCRYGQGFLIAQPLPFDNIIEWIHSQVWQDILAV